MTAEPAAAPIPLTPNQPRSFYRDSGAIARFRRTAPTGDGYRPEDWVASTTSRFARSPAGLTTLPGGVRLADAVAADPAAWLGPEHTAAYGADTGLLVKLLDAGQRLPLHTHPDRAFARAHLGSAHGKTEAWYVLDPGAEVRLGFVRDVTAGELAGWVAAGDTGAMLDAVHRVPVAPGDALLCPAGMPHAIGAGVLLVELQEPTDFSVLLEWEGSRSTVPPRAISASASAWPSAESTAGACPLPRWTGCADRARRPGPGACSRRTPTPASAPSCAGANRRPRWTRASRCWSASPAPGR
ncbi:class I mannose-6-phosphate isomerase [Streptomyces sp. NPDC007983]|uniref:class I mannose-6-phosphate isomerase n=1 Tax=Streptomyces sp. NPDC007983 TaxID=3364800 RepID=UPI0036E03C07